MDMNAELDRLFRTEDMTNMKDQEEDIKVSFYTMACAAEYGCPQKYIKHVAQICGVDWPPPGKAICIRDIPERPF